MSFNMVAYVLSYIYVNILNSLNFLKLFWCFHHQIFLAQKIIFQIGMNSKLINRIGIIEIFIHLQ